MRDGVFTVLVCAVCLIGLWQIGVWLAALVGPFFAAFAVAAFVLIVGYEANRPEAVAGHDKLTNPRDPAR